MRVVCITNDVEATTINGEAYNSALAKRVAVEAIPMVLQIYRKYNVHATFFCQGMLVEQYPEIVEMIEHDGHEVACHGWSHDSALAFDNMTQEQQIEHLQKARIIIEKYTSNPLLAFRAPALRVDQHTHNALASTGFWIDSSVAPQRIDFFMSMGSINKLKWLFAPRCIYRTSENDLSRKGHGNIIEVPVSAFGLPYISTLMRINTFITRITRFFLYTETKHNNNKIVNFLFHPGELLEGQAIEHSVVRRTKNPFSYFFSGYLRTKLKKRNLGDRCAVLLEKEILFWKKEGYEFITISDAVNRYGKI